MRTTSERYVSICTRALGLAEDMCCWKRTGRPCAKVTQPKEHRDKDTIVDGLIQRLNTIARDQHRHATKAIVWSSTTLGSSTLGQPSSPRAKRNDMGHITIAHPTLCGLQRLRCVSPAPERLRTSRNMRNVKRGQGEKHQEKALGCPIKGVHQIIRSHEIHALFISDSVLHDPENKSDTFLTPAAIGRLQVNCTCPTEGMENPHRTRPR
ncbi:hypothetical protein HDK90DRAFT_474073 [Phyllosticta capitalensis]|uniref:Uncharacterized protein n=1 Tax=Phyllosticta capitalensis TaxID=121624 RepID=A0ABR1Z4J9_9PEZI